MSSLTIETLTPEWMTGILRKYGILFQSQVTSVTITNQEKHHLELRVTYSEEAPANLKNRFYLKWYSGGSGLQEARFFHHIPNQMSPYPQVPKCFFVSPLNQQNSIAILLEDLTDTHYSSTFPHSEVSDDMFCDVMESAVAIHSAWWDHPEIKSIITNNTGSIGVAHEAISEELIRKNESHFINTVFPQRQKEFEESNLPISREFFEGVVHAWAAHFIKRINTGKNLTIIQGDAQIGNTLLPRAGTGAKPIIIDWEGCTWGLAVWDLCRTLIATRYSSAHRKRLEGNLIPRYHDEILKNHNNIDYTLDQCKEDYRLSVMANIPHALSWEDTSYVQSALRAFNDWHCEELLK